jgi:hypothetical protein
VSERTDNELRHDRGPTVATLAPWARRAIVRDVLRTEKRFVDASWGVQAYDMALGYTIARYRMNPDQAGPLDNLVNDYLREARLDSV